MGKAAVIYWSGTGNTEMMARAIVDGMDKGGSPAELINVSAAPADLSAYDKIAFGCPSMGAEELEESEFEPYYASVEAQLSGKKIALFGSYGWGDGEWMRKWAARAQASGAQLLDEGLQQHEVPDEGDCAAYGGRFATF